MHPGATYKLIKLKATLKLFTTGSITLTAPSVLIAREAINQIYPILMEFKRALPHEQTNSQQQQIHSIKSEPTLFGMNTNSSLFNQNFSSPSIKQEMISQRPPISTISSSFNYYNNVIFFSLLLYVFVKFISNQSQQKGTKKTKLLVNLQGIIEVTCTEVA